MTARDANASDSPLAYPLAGSNDPSEPRPRAPASRVGDATQPLSGASLSGGWQPAGQRLSQRQLVVLADRLAERERSIVQTVARFRLIRVDQLRRLFFHEIANVNGSARICRRSLAQLCEAGLMRRLERQVGGIRGGGSSGYVYTLAPAGRRLVAYWSGSGLASDRGVHEPGVGFVEHTLAIAELYVTLVEADRAGLLELVGFETEPACWRSYATPFGASAVVKPDALIRVGKGEFEQRSFVEIDRATQGRGALLRKLQVYLAYYRSGREQAADGVFPRIVWITTSLARSLFLEQLVAALPPEGRRLFAVTTGPGALAALSGEDQLAAEEGAGR